jgi:dTDP-glucose pyrophosphorylase
LRASEPEPGALFFQRAAQRGASAGRFQAVILAGGRGRRFEPLGAREPKALLPVLGVPLIAHQLGGLAEVGVREVVLVSGHLGARLREFVGAGERFGLVVQHVEQEEQLGIAHALLVAEPWLTRPFLCLLGDLWFAHADLARLTQAFGDGSEARLGVRAGDGEEELARNYEVVLAADGGVSAVREKPPAGRGLRGVGVYAFPRVFLEAARATPRSALRGEHELTDAIQRHLEGGARVAAVAFEERDVNLTGPADLLAANLAALARAGLEQHVEPGARLGEGVVLERSLVLAGATVAPGAELVRVLVFPGEHVPAGRHVDTVFAAGQALPAAARR